jgi:hypothetical protein
LRSIWCNGNIFSMHIHGVDNMSEKEMKLKITDEALELYIFYLNF